MKVGYLGPEKTFTEKAARAMFPDRELVPVQPIRNVIRAVEDERFEYGVVPIENFYNGEVRQTLDTLIECSKTLIVMEMAFEIVHCLGALPQHSEIKQILSKDQALEQCYRFIGENYPYAEEIATSSTAEAAKIIASERRLNAGAIAPEAALLASGLEVLAKDICPNNRTRFIAVSRHIPQPTGDDKTFLAIHPPTDKPGILAAISNSFGLYNINLEYFQSRPDGKKGYFFYVELNGHQSESRVKKAIDTVKSALDPKDEHPETIKILGSFPNTHWKNDN